MKSPPYRRLLRVLSGSSQGQLYRQIQFLKAENEVLRARIQGPVRVTARERYRLLRLAKPLGAAVRDLVTIVKPDTLMRWIKASGKKHEPKPSSRKPGRPRTPEDIRQIVLRIARETGWGYTRILGELKKLDIHVSRSTVVNILRQASLPTGPQRGSSGCSRSRAGRMPICSSSLTSPRVERSQPSAPSTPTPGGSPRRHQASRA